MGRQLGIEPSVKAEFQPYNLAEMFRAVVVSKMGLLMQQKALSDIISDIENPTVASVQDNYATQYPTLKKLPYQYAKRTIDRTLKTGNMDNFPKPSAILPFWACDTHYSKLKQDGRVVFFSFKVEGKGMVTLKFELPKGDRFVGEKTTRPTVYYDKKNRLTFGFTVINTAPKTKAHTAVMGVDLGRVTPFVATVVTKDGGFSQPVIPNKRVNNLSKKMGTLNHLSSLLFAKEILNIERGRNEKAEVLRTERLRVRSKVSRLKAERIQHIARHITLIAQEHNALIALENLSWVPNSKWEQSLTQTAISHAAKVRGVKTRTVNPKNTSQDCTICGLQVKHSKRSTKCIPCSKELNRDVLASRNVAKRAGATLAYYYPLNTRLPGPVTTGLVTNSDFLTVRLVT